jgi:hypothetical protein
LIVEETVKLHALETQLHLEALRFDIALVSASLLFLILYVFLILTDHVLSRGSFHTDFWNRACFLMRSPSNVPSVVKVTFCTIVQSGVEEITAFKVRRLSILIIHMTQRLSRPLGPERRNRV